MNEDYEKYFKGDEELEVINIKWFIYLIYQIMQQNIRLYIIVTYIFLKINKINLYWIFFNLEW